VEQSRHRGGRTRCRWLDVAAHLRSTRGERRPDELFRHALPEQRFGRRTQANKRSEHRDAALLVERRGGTSELVAAHDRLDEVVAARTRTRRVTVSPDDVDATYRERLLRLDS